MGEASVNALQYFQNNIGKRRKDRRRKKNSFSKCKICNKYPIFVHEEEPYKWILAEWNDENRPVKHVCKLKGNFNELQRVSK